MMVKVAGPRSKGSVSILGALVACAVVLPALALAQDPDPIAAELRKLLAQQDGPPAEPINWDALNWDPWSLTTASKQQSLSAKDDPVDTPLDWDRKVNPDGSSAVIARKRLPTAVDAKVGVDLGVAPKEPNYLIPDRLVNGTAPANSGAAWANVTVSNASIDARLDPSQDQARIGTTLKKSVPVNDALSVSVESGYAVIDSFAGSGSAAPWGMQPAGGNPSRIYSADGVARLTFEPTGTTLSTGTRLTSTDEKWRRSLGAEQKLFGGLNITGSVSETDTGAIDRSLTAGFKKSW
ncbi:MAG TPA: hypothetical protein VHA55_14730 [Pseudorhodoplanes sp.]|nr:hypothetical protein [Pseudorhodoplanes sp.]